jgi:hypothetical protein
MGMKTKSFRTTVALLLIGLAIAAAVSAASHADPPQLLSRLRTGLLQEGQIRSNEEAFEVNRGILKDLASNRLGRVSLPVLQTDKTFFRTYHKIRDKTSTWIGKDAAGEFTLLLTLGEDHFFGKAISRQEEVIFQPSGIGSAVVSKRIDPRMEVPLVDDERIAPQRPEAPYAAFDLPDDGTRIDLMVLYTVGMAAAYPGSQIDTRIQYLIDQSNLALTNSQIETELNLVYSQPVNFPDDSIGGMDAALRDLTNNVGVFADIETLRTLYGADQVALLRRFVDEGCGMAWLLQQPSDARNAYSLVHDGSKTDNSGTYCSDLTFVHELGHNLGCEHDRANASYIPRYPYSYGYQDPDGLFRTVMAYADGCPGGCPRISYFSNPNLTYQGKPVGIAEGSPNAADNARTINSTRVAMAAYRAAITPTIRVLAPNGGESWQVGRTYSITWATSDLSSTVTIELYRGGILQRTLASDLPDSGAFRWSIPAQLPVGANYSIRIKSDASAGAVFDDSDNYFNVVSIRSQVNPGVDLLLLNR